jgi:hypothetical protein
MGDFDVDILKTITKQNIYIYIYFMDKFQVKS